MSQTPGGLPLFELSAEAQDFGADLAIGLSTHPKAIPCKYFYDKRGSELFDAITELDEYYLTRTEVAIMRRWGAEMAAHFGSDCLLVEYGSGSSAKIRLLLDHLEAPRAYVPIDISREHLIESADILANAYPSLAIIPIWADYTRPFRLPASILGGQRVVYFPGSTIGNFGPAEAQRFLRRVADLVGAGGGLLIGVDLKKDAGLLDRAYDDRQGITAAFNLNLLVRANRELGTDFQLDRFAHLAFYSPDHGRVEIYIASLADQAVTLAGRTYEIAAGERILTEYSYKYDLVDFAELANRAGFEVIQVWTDPDRLFSVQYLERIGQTERGRPARS